MTTHIRPYDHIATRQHRNSTTAQPHDHTRTATQSQSNTTTPRSPPHYHTGSRPPEQHYITACPHSQPTPGLHDHTAPEHTSARPHGHARTTTPPQRLTEPWRYTTTPSHDYTTTPPHTVPVLHGYTTSRLRDRATPPPPNRTATHAQQHSPRATRPHSPQATQLDDPMTTYA
jgi:hypothetical protein